MPIPNILVSKKDERFRFKADILTYVDRQPPAKTSNPFTTPEPTLDAEAVLERIDVVRRKSLRR